MDRQTAIILISTILFFLLGILQITDLEKYPETSFFSCGAMSIGFCLWKRRPQSGWPSTGSHIRKSQLVVL